ncbi:M15 family metallopeptidase [Methylosinus sp. H3A]|uniref:M15 family metallopeptidase n=1 Tax=Methylosinus sp. H3A TaxID=2785786 RepID=UPI0018C20F4C|nr:M15 family metallopeptidase [Methylosinus sp. H3A]MBG0811639.1 M15 family metallopeptidase [Methylosinus sp. H3A]
MTSKTTRDMLAAASACVACTAAAASLPPGFVRLADLAPQIVQDMRYAGFDNFTGRPVPGYGAAQCWLREDAAKALIAAQVEAKAEGFELILYDCYRPRRAVAAFIDWAKSSDESMKARYYPHETKRDLFARGYIAEKSSHSTGLAVDLGVLGWDFGTPFDFFDERSWTASKDVSAMAQEHRRRLEALMRRHGFHNLPTEWWHFAFTGSSEAPSFDVEIE